MLDGSGYRDGVERTVGQLPHGVHLQDLDVADIQLFELLGRAGDEVPVNIDARNMPGEPGQARGHEARAGADLEDLFVSFEAQGLQHPAFDRRRHHGFAVPERYLDVGEGKRFEAGRDEVFAR